MNARSPAIVPLADRQIEILDSGLDFLNEDTLDEHYTASL